jgi:hypothetical protein
MGKKANLSELIASSKDDKAESIANSIVDTVVSVPETVSTKLISTLNDKRDNIITLADDLKTGKLNKTEAAAKLGSELISGTTSIAGASLSALSPVVASSVSSLLKESGITDLNEKSKKKLSDSFASYVTDNKNIQGSVSSIFNDLLT